MGVKRRVSNLVLSRVLSFEAWIDLGWYKQEMNQSVLQSGVYSVKTAWQRPVKRSFSINPRMPSFQLLSVRYVYCHPWPA